VPPELVVVASSCLVKDPNLRLELVKWDDFDPPALRPLGTNDNPKERVRRRRAIAEKDSQAVWTPVEEQAARSSRRTVNKMQADIQSLIHQECVASDLFPPLEIHDSQATAPVLGRFSVSFKPSTECNLSESISIFLEIELLDNGSEAVKITYIAGIGETSLSWDLALAEPFSEIFRGVYNQRALSERLQAVLYGALDKAQIMQRSSKDRKATFVWLTPTLPPEFEVNR
jgi:hypothetical protein